MEAIVGVAATPSVGGVWTVLPPMTWGGVPRRPEGRGDDGKGGPRGEGGGERSSLGSLGGTEGGWWTEEGSSDGTKGVGMRYVCGVGSRR